MTLQLYDLALADIDVRPSPFCWLAKFALLHKRLDFETVPLRFTEKKNYPDPDYGLLPILKDGEELICDSANIIAHIEEKYPGDKTVATAGEQAAADFYAAWVANNLFPALGPMMYVRILAAAHEDDQAYYRETREKRLGMTLEAASMAAGKKTKVEKVLQTLAAPLARQNFLGGEAPNLCDYIVFSPMMWQRAVTLGVFYETPQAVDAWRERMLDLFDGYARKAKSAG